MKLGQRLAVWLSEPVHAYRADDMWHIACICQPQIFLCGVYDPDICGIDIGFSGDDNVCRDCKVVWHQRGCGYCGECSAAQGPCNGCWESSVEAVE